MFRIIELQIPKQMYSKKIRLTVDEHADYIVLSELYARLYKGKPIPLEEVVMYIDSHPHLALINHNIKHSRINQELTPMKISNLSNVFASEPW